MSANNELKTSISKASDERIFEILDRKTDYSPEAVQYAEEEFHKRQLSSRVIQNEVGTHTKSISLDKIKFIQRDYSTKDHNIDVLDEINTQQKLPAVLKYFCLIMVLYHGLDTILYNYNLFKFYWPTSTSEYFRTLLYMLVSVMPVVGYFLLFRGYRMSWFIVLFYCMYCLTQIRDIWYFLSDFSFSNLVFQNFRSTSYLLALILTLIIMHRGQVLKVFEITSSERYKAYVVTFIFAWVLRLII